MRPLLHIGYHKTATTWFQKRCYPFVENLRYVDRRVVQEAVLADSTFRFDPERARGRLDEGDDGRPLLLCEEELSGNVHSGGMAGAQSKDVADRLHTLFPDAAVVIFIREQVEMAAALYRHYVREGGTHRPHRYFFPERYRRDVARHRFKYPVFTFDHLEYNGLIDYYRTRFGEANVHVFAYEQFRADPAEFVAGFCARLGLQVDPASLSWGQENPGDGMNALRLARFLNRFTYRSVLDKRYWFQGISNKLRSQLPRALNRTPLRGTSPDAEALLGKDLVATIRDRFAEPNRRLADTLGLPLEGFGYACSGASTSR